MKKILLHTYMCILLSTLTGCYGYRQVGLLQERDDLPQYDSVAYEPYRLQVNDEIIYRVITMDETIAKTLSANNSGSGQYANSYRIYSDGTVDIPFLPPVKLEGLTELEAQDTLRKAMREIIPDADVKLAMYNKQFTVLGDANSGTYSIYKERLTIFQALAIYVSRDRGSFYKQASYSSFLGLITSSVSLLITVLNYIPGIW